MKLLHQDKRRQRTKHRNRQQQRSRTGGGGAALPAPRGPHDDLLWEALGWGPAEHSGIRAGRF